MRCPRCGRLNVGDAWDCAYCGAALQGVSTRTAAVPAPAPAPEAAPRSSGVVATLILAAVLALAGLGAVQASGLLQHVIRAATAGALAAQVCTELQQQDYGALASQIEPTATSGSSQAALNPTSAATALQGLDASAGKITSCQYRQVSFVANASNGSVANFALTVRRAQQQSTESLVLVLIQQPDGTWKIGPSSNLLGGN